MEIEPMNECCVCGDAISYNSEQYSVSLALETEIEENGEHKINTKASDCIAMWHKECNKLIPLDGLEIRLFGNKVRIFRVNKLNEVEHYE